MRFRCSKKQGVLFEPHWVLVAFCFAKGEFHNLFFRAPKPHVRSVYLLKGLVVLLEIKEFLLKIFKQFLENKKYLLNTGIFLLEIGLLILIFYVAREFSFQMKITENMKILQKELVDTTLPLTNLLSKTRGNVEFIEDDAGYYHTIGVKPALYYSRQHKSHKLEVILLNPSYNLIDCSGDIISNVVYPVKFNFIWQPMPNAIEQYELICERYFHSSKHSKKNVYRKILLRHINAVKFKFLEHTTSGGFRAIEPKKLSQIELHNSTDNIKVAAVQIGMLVQSSDPIYYKVRHNRYNLFNEHLNFLDQFLHKVIYISTQSNLS